MLEHHGDALGRAGDRLAVRPGAARRDRSVSPAMQRSKRGLAAAARSHDAQDFLLPDREIELVERDDGAVEEHLAGILRHDGVGACRRHAGTSFGTEHRNGACPHGSPPSSRNPRVGPAQPRATECLPTAAAARGARQRESCPPKGQQHCRLGRDRAAEKPVAVNRARGHGIGTYLGRNLRYYSQFQSEIRGRPDCSIISTKLTIRPSPSSAANDLIEGGEEWSVSPSTAKATTSTSIPSTPLLWVIREQVGLTGTKYGCGIAQCGACTVHIDGAAVRSCSLPVSEAVGKQITTIEGLAANGVLHKVQKAWIDHEVPQCGYCQCGMIMAVAALLKEKPKPTDADINREITNICRCGTFQQVRAAIHAAANA